MSDNIFTSSGSSIKSQVLGFKTLPIFSLFSEDELKGVFREKNGFWSSFCLKTRFWGPNYKNLNKVGVTTDMINFVIPVTL